MDQHAVNAGPELREPVQAIRKTTPIVARAPMLDESLCVVERHTLRPIPHRLAVRPTDGDWMPMQVLSCFGRHPQGEQLDHRINPGPTSHSPARLLR